MSKLDVQRVLVDQLRREAKVDRKKVSISIKEMIEYCEAHKKNDCLVSGFSGKENAYKEKSGCQVI